MTGFKLFGVEINLGEKKESSSIRKRNNLERAKDESCMRKSKSMGNLQACNSQHMNNNVAGYLSDGLIQNKSNTRKKGLPWTEDEHRSFLIGLKKMGKGDWKGISKKHVPTRTPTQVVSHAQKYFIRVTATEKKKRRSSLFDIHFEEPTPLPQASPASVLFDKASEQVSTNLVAPLKNIGEIQGKPSTSGLVAASEKPPLLLMAETYVPDFCLMPPYMIGVPPVGQSFPAAKFVPAVFFPAMNYPRPGHAYLPSSHGNFSTIQF